MSDNTYYSPSTRKLPEIFIDYDNNALKLTGRCIKEDVHDFFVDLTHRLSFIENLKVIVDLEYLNSSSLRHLVFMLTDNRLSVTEVEWLHGEEDFDVEEKGSDVKWVVLEKKPNLKFEIIKKPIQ
jgi:hypothetical protein